ncbi:MAG: ABC transporter ATP-binding protein/permease [Lachnospiraceae bacterium]|nr:ABC transporter ATP-binding protein/permease [Lachnospiraceae bacterium]
MKSIIRIIKMAKPWYHLLFLATMALFVVSAVNLAVPEFIRRIIALMESGINREILSNITTLVLVLLGLFIIRTICQFLTSYISHIASWRLVMHARKLIYEHFQKLPMRYYSNRQTGELMSRVVNDTATFEDMTAHSIPDCITNIVTFVGVFIILLTINPTLALLVLIPIPFIALMGLIIRKMKGHFKEGQKNLAELSGILQDNFSGMKEIQIFNKQEYEYKRMGKYVDKHGSVLLKGLFYVGVLNPAVGFVTAIGTIIVLIAGPYMAYYTGLSISDLVAFILYISLLYTPVVQIARLVEDIQMAVAGSERVFEVLDTEPEIKDSSDSLDVDMLSGQLAFEHVSFAYEDGLPVLDDISFDLKPGKMLALVGPTGVGKSTISSLITRFYEPSKGVITMDGIDISNMTLQSLRKQLSLVLQDVFLFNGTICDNIAYGCDGATKEQVRAAAKTACIDEYISSLPEGYDTVIGERGIRLSGGQKQRISIARSVLRDAPILILDEATSAVDTETEKEIQGAIDSIAGTKTLIVIAHRLSTVQKADKILVLQEGKVVESGNHEELLKLDGVYAKLCKVQMA